MRQPVNEAEFQKLKDLPKGTPWAERYSQIQRAMPQAANFDWSKAFEEDPDLFGSVLKGILGLDGPRKHTWGPRSLPDDEEMKARVAQWQGKDITMQPFLDAFIGMTEGMSQRQLAAKTGLNRMTIQRLLSGEIEPTIYDLEQIARAFKKQPGFWLEYRIVYIVNALVLRMTSWAPESTISIYRKLRAAEMD